MNNAVLIQHAHGEQEHLLDVVGDWHRAYCEHQDMDYWERYGRAQKKYSVYWDSIFLILEALRAGYEYVFWLDNDAVITNLAIDLREALPEDKDLGLCRTNERWWKEQCENPHSFLHPHVDDFPIRDGFPVAYNTGAFYIRNSGGTLRFFETCWNWIEHDLPQGEQVAVNQVLHSTFPMERFVELDRQWNTFMPIDNCPDSVVVAWHGCSFDLKVRQITSVLEHLTAVLSATYGRRTAAHVIYKRATGRIKAVLKGPADALRRIPPGCGGLASHAGVSARDHLVKNGVVFAK